jgi:hypothetical protein
MANATSISDRSAPAEAVASKQGPVIILIEDEPEIRQ